MIHSRHTSNIDISCSCRVTILQQPTRLLINIHNIGKEEKRNNGNINQDKEEAK